MSTKMTPRRGCFDNVSVWKLVWID